MASKFQDLRSPVKPSKVASPRSRKGTTPLTTPLSFRTAAPVATPRSQKKVAQINFTSKKELDEPQGYRTAKSLPYELQHHCVVYFEEQLYTSALSLLNNIITSGTSYPVPRGPAFTPPPSHIALTNTLLVHPLHTTRASSAERLEVSTEALLLLKNILATLGPVNANLYDAFAFSSPQSISLRQSRRSNGAERRPTASNLSENAEEDLVIVAPLANENSLWERAQDFWHVVGWAFNCSVKYPRRWQYWRVWLEYMLDVLDADWNERSRIDAEKHEAKPKQRAHALPEQTNLQGSLLISYLAGQGRSSSTIRRVVRSIFADGSEDSLRAFPQVFENETKERTVNKSTKWKSDHKVDIEEDKYGDYTMDNEEDDEDHMDLSANFSSQDMVFSCICNEDGQVDDRAHRIVCEKCGIWQHSKCVGIKKVVAEADNFHFICATCKNPGVEMDWERTTTPSPPPSLLGGPEAVVLRLRLLALLSRACYFCPDLFTSNSDLYPMFFEYIAPLPLPTFSLFVSPTPHLLDSVLSSLVQVLLVRLLPNSTPTPENDELSQSILETCFLPFAASTSSVEDNAKVSILVETLLRLFIAACPVKSTPRFVNAIEQGIAARQAKTIDKRRKPTGSRGKEEAADRFWLDSSADRLRHLLYFVQMTGSVSKRRS